MAGTTQTTDAASERQRAREQRGIRSNQRVRSDSTRLPAPPRQRRPALAALAVLLIAGGAAIAALLAMRVDERTPVLVLRGDVAAGQQITEEHLDTTQVASEDTDLIPESQLDQVVGQYARVELVSGQLLDTTMLAGAGLMTEGRAAVGASLAPGFLPAGGLREGDVVDLVSIVSGSGEVVVEDARVSSVYTVEGQAAENGATGVVATFVVDREDEAEVAGLAALNQLVVTLVERGAPLAAEEE
ncbi:SAF domain-containing protein [Jiangella asiatica]|uniref:Flagellar biosynthesis protein FlgA n=1 Tax=Jiangella asiatica TaxID=2530372 RepID=A0A4R5CNR6_9ACTN|nr:SAF domain-containing protein [Jiangella asiatica]TDE00034.1 flagellar biosynthesis protein FlgA [Jiangella asiatica]